MHPIFRARIDSRVRAHLGKEVYKRKTSSSKHGLRIFFTELEEREYRRGSRKEDKYEEVEDEMEVGKTDEEEVRI